MSTRHRGATLLALSGLVGAAALTGATAATAAADALPIYAVRSEGLTQDQATALQRAFGLRTVERTPEGVVTFTDESRHLKVPGIDRGAGTPDESGRATTLTQLDLTTIRGLRAVPLADATKRVTEALRGVGLLPAEATASASFTTIDIHDANGTAVVSAPLDTTVTFALRLGGLPLEGPGSKIRVSLDGSGAVTQLTYATRVVTAVGTKPVLTLEDGRRDCAKALGANPLGSVEYAYANNMLGTGTTHLEPYFRCQAAETGESAPLIYLPAVVGSTAPPLDPSVPPRSATSSTSPDLGTRWVTRIDVGSSGTGTCQGIPSIPADITGFNNQFTSAGIPVQFSWTGANSWEQDFKDPMFPGGQDHLYADDVDMTYFRGLGGPFGLSFAGCSSVSDNYLRNTEARWGNRDAEWMSLHTPNLLQPTASGQAWWQRWGQAFRGLHQINSFETGVVQCGAFGSRYGDYLLRHRLPVLRAWSRAAIDTQPSWVRWATMGPIGTSWIANFNDHFWGAGPVGPDTLPSVGYWKISGLS
ncbi:hypothetical protein FHX81_3482 [Saccharothrix saharensis]|uniref:Uncharacterized protein n=1 Tax=Saccharothrix saharensis TaxID=571190 RepID=A0A543JE98_9PSEU|nr:DUF6345 domain-containing protein [Saccharothrix saharensis]TQM81121.1 hypothetical protein FHX81_3482 [Saccharothrix saharensis]